MEEGQEEATAPPAEDKTAPARKTAPLMSLLGRVQAAGSTALQATRTAGSTAMNNGFVLEVFTPTLRLHLTSSSDSTHSKSSKKGLRSS